MKDICAQIDRLADVRVQNQIKQIFNDQKNEEKDF